MRENGEFPHLKSVILPNSEALKEVPMPAPKNKHSKKATLKRTNQKSTAFTRNAPNRNARHLPTRKMNNRGGR